MRSGIVGPIVIIVRYIDLRSQKETFPTAPLAVRWPSTLDVRFQAFCREASMVEMKARSCHRAGAERMFAYPECRRRDRTLSTKSGLHRNLHERPL